jgi:YD repeat-containing protein
LTRRVSYVGFTHSGESRVEYGYDGFGRRTTMTTFQTGTNWDSATWPGGTGDTTTWVYEDATGLLLEKRYADHTAQDPRNIEYVSLLPRAVPWVSSHAPLGAGRVQAGYPGEGGHCGPVEAGCLDRKGEWGPRRAHGAPSGGDEVNLRPADIPFRQMRRERHGDL